MGEEPTYTFTPDPELGAHAVDCANAAVDVASKNFGAALDFSETSVRELETILDQLHRLRVEDDPGEERIWLFARLFGSYLGEVIRRHYGGEWGMIEAEGERFPGFMFGATTLWPWSRAYNRITEGPENNVHHYYASMVEYELRLRH